LLSSILSIAAIASLVKLLPYHWSQQAKLKELRTQVKETEARVNQLRQELENNFDPQQAQNLMHQYGTQINRTQSRIFWLEDKQD
jgi:outer membrane murein-binding lipoprotein Lpp